MSQEYKGLDLCEPLSESPKQRNSSRGTGEPKDATFHIGHAQKNALPYLTSGTVTELSAMLVDRIICGALNTTGGRFPSAQDTVQQLGKGLHLEY